MKSLLILLPLSLFSILHTTNAIPLPDELRHDSGTLTLKHDQSHGKEQGRHFMLFAKEPFPGKHQTTPTTPTTIISTARNPDANERLPDLEESETKPQTSSSPESPNNHPIIITPSNNKPKQPAQATRPLKKPGVLRTVSSRLLHGFSIPSFSSSSKNNSAKQNIPTTSHNAASDDSNSKASLEPWMIVLGMIWLVPITVVLVEMLEYAWMWCRGDTNILASIESGRKSRFWISADKSPRGEKDMKVEGGYVVQPYYDDDDSSDDGFDDLVP